MSTTPLAEIKAIIFDLDGVLFLSSDCHRIAYQTALDAIGITAFDYREVAGMKTLDAIRSLSKNNGLDLSEQRLEELVALKQSTARKLLREVGRVSNNCEAFIQDVSRRYRLALATSASTGTVDVFFEKCCVQPYFEVILNSADILQAKPHPEIYQKAVERLGLNAKECIVVEDAIQGAQAAYLAGIPLIIVTPPENQAVFARFAPMAYVSEVADIRNLL